MGLLNVILAVVIRSEILSQDPARVWLPPGELR